VKERQIVTPGAVKNHRFGDEVIEDALCVELWKACVG
jgi:hypothetical protein